MAIAVDPSRTWDYVLEADRGTERPTTWELRVLTARETAEIQDGAAFAEKDATISIRSGSSQLRALKLGLAGVRDFRDETGADVPFESENDNKRNPTRRIVTDRFLDRIEDRDRAELARAISEGNRVTETERKN